MISATWRIRLIALIGLLILLSIVGAGWWLGGREVGGESVPNRSAEEYLAKGVEESGPTEGVASGSTKTLPLNQVAQVTIQPEGDRRAWMEASKARAQEGRFQFARRVEVDVSPRADGTWDQTRDGHWRWRLRVDSPGATSLNLGVTDFHMPEGGRFSFSAPGGPSPFREFTVDDNEAHGQLWTPILEGESALLTVQLPAGERFKKELKFHLTAVNHGFRHFGQKDSKIGGGFSGSCNVDVICSAGEAGTTLINAYRNQIRSVGAYTLGGVDTCSGAAITNTAEDGTPFFLTADHCGVTAVTAPSMVVYWNFENSTCRLPGSTASGGIGDGDLTQFNTGAIFRAGSSASDFTLVELDDPIDPAHDVYLAGWNRNFEAPTQSVGIHHPAVAEKRISFDFDAATITSYLNDTSPGDGSNWRVGGWDIGTTQGGSSGSPLFDQNGLIIGQLQGGDAACGNSDPDWYGRLYTSWDGEGTDSTRLSNWLDPLDNGDVAFAGMEAGATLSVDDVSVDETDSGQTTLTFTVSLSAVEGFQVDVDFATEDGTATAGADYVATSGRLQFPAGVTSRTVTVTVNGDLDPEENETFLLRLSNANDAAIEDSVGLGTIRNDDFIVPMIVGSLTGSGTVGAAFEFQVPTANTPTEYLLTGNVPVGMAINAETGLISWVPSASGVFEVGVEVSNPAGMDTGTLSVTVADNPLADAIEQGGTGRVLRTGPEPWLAVTDTTNDGVDAAVSGVIVDNSSSWIEMDVSGPAFVFFHWKVDSEEGFDLLTASVDGDVRKSISGNVDWHREVLELSSGSHTVRWSYQKDGSVGVGLDKGWLDEVIVSTDSPLPLIVSPLTASVVPGGPLIYQTRTSRPATSIVITGLPAGLMADASGLITGTAAPGDYSFGITATNQAGTDPVSVDLEILPGLPIAASLDIESLTLAPGSVAASPWFTQSAMTHDGVDAAQSGDVNNGEASRFALDVIGPGTLSFWWKVESEDGFDFLTVSLDGEIEGAITGFPGWAQVSLEVPSGLHRAEWSYIKDGSVSVGSDAGWVDEVTLTGFSGWIVAQGIPGRAGLFVDVEGDRFVNVEEYFYNLDASVANPGTVPMIQESGDHFRVSVPKRPGVSGITATVRVSTDLISWTTTHTRVVSETETELIVEETFPEPRPEGVFFLVELNVP